MVSLIVYLTKPVRKLFFGLVFVDGEIIPALRILASGTQATEELRIPVRHFFLFSFCSVSQLADSGPRDCGVSSDIVCIISHICGETYRFFGRDFEKSRGHGIEQMQSS